MPLTVSRVRFYGLLPRSARASGRLALGAVPGQSGIKSNVGGERPVRATAQPKIDDPANPGWPRVSSQAWAFLRDRCARVRVSPDARGRAASERSEIVSSGLTYQAQTVL